MRCKSDRKMSISNLLHSTENNDVDHQGELTNTMYDIIDDVILGLAFEVHRAAKIGTLFIDATDTESEKQYEIVNEKGLDIFGQVPAKKQYECVCPNCGRNMAAARFAPHLEKCMGMGRNSSRIASRRIASANAKQDGYDSDDSRSKDDDWASSQEKKPKKVKTGKGNGITKVKTGNKPRSRNGGDHVTIPDPGSHPVYEKMTLEDKKALLMSTCGVISEHTRKMCTKSLRCPQHSEEQKRAVRAYLLGHPRSLDSDDVHVDIDTYNEDDSQSLRETLQWEAISNPSPADSSSTTGSSRRKQARGGKKKGSRGSTPTSMHELT